MFEKILIANRGEIAVRIIRTARRLGIATVAVYCDTDQGTPHVEMADEAVNIGPPPASASYLLIDRIVDACRQTGAEAVHPGYGFLSERAAFATALTDNGITFIGPNARAIAAMGDKIESKRLAQAAGVSTIPGHPDALATEADALAAAQAVGFPVMIKATAGGGGKGMRIARSSAELIEGFRSAQSEAAASFGDDRVFVERYVVAPRHIEVQVLGDRHGNIIHLGERECSIQRRNQKIVEEAPSPAVDAPLRAAMGLQAVTLARAVGYDSAGTVEFILDADHQFYFLEMNTRLQVEHPVTELVTGADLVEQMIRVAAGEPLALSQADIRIDGWAIEARLYAEDPYRDFLPSIGRLNRYRPPPVGVHGDGEVRIDSGVGEGSEISIYFDPLIAKLVTRAGDRDGAISTMAAALDRFVVDGIAHNQPFLSALMDHPRWRTARLTTGFIAEEYPGGFNGVTVDAELRQAFAVIALTIELSRQERLQALAGRLNGEGAMRRNWTVKLAGELMNVSLDQVAALIPVDLTVSFDDHPAVPVKSEWRAGDPLWAGTVGGRALTVQVRPATAGIRLSRRGVDMVAHVMRPRVAELDRLMPTKRPAVSGNRLRCPMPGLVVAVHAAVGQRVAAGEAVAIVEAMKMENVLRAERDAIVTRIDAKPGDVLSVDDVILEFADERDDEE